jgi:putative MATE family efflux protein
MEKQMEGNLTEGPILKVLTQLALPIMASAFLGTAYSITDMAWIGMLGSKAVAGVGVGGMFCWFSHGLVTLARMGGQVYTAQAIGKGEKEAAKEFSRGTVQLSILLGILYGAVCFFFADFLVGLFGLTDPVTIGYGVVYLKITCGLVIFSYINYALTGLYTAQGDSKTPLKANFAGLVVNMILDPLMILGIGPFPKMGVVGAAVATVTAHIIVTAGLFISVIKSKEEENILKNLQMTKISKKNTFGSIIRLGGPASLQSMIYCGISMVLTKMVAVFGEPAVATQRVGGQIESVSWNTADGFAAAMNAFAAQNFGAGKMDRVRKGYKISAITVGLWGVLVALAFIFLPVQISSVFFHEPEVIPVSVSYLVIIGICEPFMCIELMAIGAISGLGNTKICSIVSIIVTGMRIPLAIILSSTSLGVDGVWWALALTSITKGILFHLIFYWQCNKIERKMKTA